MNVFKFWIALFLIVSGTWGECIVILNSGIGVIYLNKLEVNHRYFDPLLIKTKNIYIHKVFSKVFSICNKILWTDTTISFIEKRKIVWKNNHIFLINSFYMYLSF